MQFRITGTVDAVPSRSRSRRGCAKFHPNPLSREVKMIQSSTSRAQRGWSRLVLGMLCTIAAATCFAFEVPARADSSFEADDDDDDHGCHADVDDPQPLNVESVTSFDASRMET